MKNCSTMKSDDDLPAMPAASNKKVNMTTKTDTCADTSGSGKLWRTIVDLTGMLKNDIAESLRISIYTKLNTDNSPNIKRHYTNLIMTGHNLVFSSSKSLPAPGTGSVIFCLPKQTASNIQNLVPVMLEAKKRGLVCGIVTGDDFSANLSAFAGEVPIVTLYDLTSQISMSEKKSIALEIRSTYKSLIKVFKDNAPSLSDQLERYKGDLIREISTSLQMRIACAKLLQQWAPSCVVLIDDFWPFEYQLAAQASKLGIHSMVIQHGVMAEFWWPFVSDRYLLWGAPFKEQMMEMGAPANRLNICGMPATDHLFKKYDSIKTTSYSTKSPVFLILSHTQAHKSDPELFDNYRSLITGMIESDLDIRWQVKLHPIEDDTFYRDLDDKVFNRLKFLPKSTSLEESVNNADIVCTLYSTAGLEAMMMQKPLFVLNVAPRVEELAWWPNFGGGLYIKTICAFKEFITRLKENRNTIKNSINEQNQFLKNSFSNRGYAAKSIVTLIEKYNTASKSKKD